MRYPQVVVCGPDEWPAAQLRELAAEHRWLVRAARQPVAARDLVREPRPTVLLVQADPAGPPDALRLVADAHRLAPDAAVVVLSEAKLPEEDRSAWAAGALDLGARYVLFPPFTRAVLEDLVGGLMAAVVRRVIGPGAEAGSVRPADDGVIDLAEARYEDG
jgi:hypothetical protein